MRNKLNQSLKLFIKAQASAQTATAVDFVSTYLLLQFFGVYYMTATAMGAVLGGLTNCIINYKWTFHVNDVRFHNVLLRYVLVWFGSFALNLWGVYILKNWLQENTGLWYSAPSLCVMLSKLIVAVLVAVLWNFTLYRYFVFRNLNIKHRYHKNGREEESFQKDERPAATTDLCGD